VDDDLEGPMAETLEEASGEPDRQIGEGDPGPARDREVGGDDAHSGPDVANPLEELTDDDPL